MKTHHSLLKPGPEITTRATEPVVQDQIVCHSALLDISRTTIQKREITNGQEAERNTYIILNPVAERFNEVVSVKSHIDNFLQNLLINL